MIIHNRQIKAAFWNDPDLLQWSRDKRWFYEGLCQLADDSGCLEDSAFAFKLHLFPSPLDADITVELISGWIDELIDQKKLVRYEVQGKKCLYLVNFHKHQSLRSPGKPEVPLPNWIKYIPPVGKGGGTYEVGNPFESADNSVTTSYDIRTKDLSNSYNQQIEIEREVEIEVGKEGEVELPTAAKNTQKILAELKKIKGWPYDKAKDTALINDFSNDFPNVDILEEVKAMAVWLIDRPFKNRSNPRSFFRNWCKKAANSNIKPITPDKTKRTTAEEFLARRRAMNDG